MNIERELYLFDLRGFLVIPDVLGPSELSELNGLLDKNLAEQNPGAILSSQVFQDFLSWGKAFRNLLAHERVMPLLCHVFEEQVRLDRYYGLHMSPGTTGVPLHGGARDIDDQSEYYYMADGRIRNGITTVSWALTDMLSGHGGFACIPGSHKSFFPRPASLREEECVTHVPLNAGDVVIFTGAVAHRGTYWAGPHRRRSLLFKYAPRHMAWTRFYSAWPREILDSLTPEQRRLFDPPGSFQGDGIGVG
jgi:hypothetical protein